MNSPNKHSKRKTKNTIVEENLHEQKKNQLLPDLLEKRPEFDKTTTSKQMHVQEVKALIKNPDQFCWVFGMDLGYHLPPKQFITWPYIFMVISGEKKLLKSTRINLTLKVPKIEELSVKTIWEKVKNDKLIMSYMPILSEQRQPPRSYLFQIIKALNSRLFKNILHEATEKRRLSQIQENRVVEVDGSILDELKQSFNLTSTLNQSISKRVNVKPVKRRKRK